VATVLFCPVTFNLAETTRMIQVARALDDGLTPVFMGYEHDFVHLIRDAGFEYRAGEPVWTDAERDQAMAFDQGRSFKSPFTEDLVTARVDLERATIREVDAKAVVTGSNMTSFIAARAEHVPLFYPVPFALTEPQVAQAKRMWIVRGDGAIAALTDRVATVAMRLAYNHLPLAPRAFASVGRANGVVRKRTVGSLIRADFNLLTEMPWELEGFDLPQDFQRVGPIFAEIDAPIPEIACELAADSRPLVYLGLGSSGSRELTMASARALGTLPINVIAPVAHFLQPGDEVPPNVHVTGLLPVHRMGDLLDAAVLHGGQGTVQTACATGVPFVGMGLQPEQTWHVKLCESRGNAISIPPKRAGGEDLIAAVRRLLDDPTIRRAADEVKESYAQEDGAAATARIIEANLAER
jgi:UDP:flavonoid glycosyltransferase YjiC (YdhE family)